MRLALKSSIQMDLRVARNKCCFKLPAGAGAELIQHTALFCGFLMALRRHFGSRMLFHITIKSHLLLHYAIKGTLLCPLLTSCWKGEDYVNIIKRRLISAHNGTQAKNLPIKAMSIQIAVHPDCQLQTSSSPPPLSPGAGRTLDLVGLKSAGLGRACIERRLVAA